MHLGRRRLEVVQVIQMRSADAMGLAQVFVGSLLSQEIRLTFASAPSANNCHRVLLHVGSTTLTEQETGQVRVRLLTGHQSHVLLYRDCFGTCDCI